ncbi:MAG: UDP-N-acetylmuramoyl-L-alanyl-D-glutamate--2,6-diaminopimelate ligase [Burkholderiaceae bacterium]
MSETPIQTPAIADLIDWLRGVAPAARELRLDSRKVEAGDVFVAVPGFKSDGRDFIARAIERGAVAVLAEGELDSLKGLMTVPVLEVPELKSCLGRLAAAFYGEPSSGLLSVAVTGTNGKTSCSQWIAQLLSRASRRCAVIGTVGSGLAGETLSQATLTTPDPISLQAEVRRLRDAGAVALAMELSSIGLEQGRAAGMKYDIALFTNLTRDHLDYHGDMAAYEAAKAILFDWPGLAHAVINGDDEAGRRLADRALARGVATTVTTLEGRGAPAGAHRLAAREVATTPQGLAFTIDWNGRSQRVAVNLVGSFNVANLLGVLGVALAAGVDFDLACSQLPRLPPPPGRMQQLAAPDAPLAVVDYAHTPDAVVQATAALRPLAAARGGQLWVVLGAGGDRDPGKRATMGAAAASGADVVVITSDNPRTEDPVRIIEHVAAGAPGARCIVDRAAAIAAAIGEASANDVVLIAGKGHEDYQDIAGSKTHFSDVEQARGAQLARAQEGKTCG